MLATLECGCQMEVEWDGREWPHIEHVPQKCPEHAAESRTWELRRWRLAVERAEASLRFQQEVLERVEREAAPAECQDAASCECGGVECVFIKYE